MPSKITLSNITKKFINIKSLAGFTVEEVKNAYRSFTKDEKKTITKPQLIQRTKQTGKFIKLSDITKKFLSKNKIKDTVKNVKAVFKNAKKENKTLTQKDFKNTYGQLKEKAMPKPKEEVLIYKPFMVEMQQYKTIRGEFTIRIFSSKLPTDAPILIKSFKGQEHFTNWLNLVEHLLKGEEVSESDGNMRIINNDSMFEFVRSNQIEHAGGCNKKSNTDVHKQTTNYKLNVFNPSVRNNNCGLACLEKLLNTKFKCSKIKEQLNLKVDAELEPRQLIYIYNNYVTKFKIEVKPLKIVGISVQDLELEKYNYILLKNKHYSVILSAEKKEKTEHRKGLLFWDIETRPYEDKKVNICVDGQQTQQNTLCDTITHVYYRSANGQKLGKISFETDKNERSVQKFIKWLKEEQANKRSYKCYAHNGGNFDLYMVISAMNATEFSECSIMTRGYTIIRYDLYDNVFKDTYCFLTDSLANLSKSFQIEHGKICDVEFDNKKMSSKQLCFYKPELTFWEFMSLKETEPNFWAKYNEYCLYDCIALYEIWVKFDECVTTLLNKIDDRLKYNCSVSNAITIGGLSLKILETYTKLNKKKQFDAISLFINTDEKHSFVNDNFKRGGISHCNKAGKHNISVCGFDIASQYPASMVSMKIPSGESEFTNKYNINFNGFYHLKNLEFDNNDSLKPVCGIKDNGVLEWNTGKKIDELYVDTEMIKYLKLNYGLVKFDVVRGLVSCNAINGSDVFGKYINTFYKEKELQDKYKLTKDKKYNASLRATIKLFLNSLSGKLVEDREKYSSLTFDSEGGINICSCPMKKEKTNSKLNPWITSGVMVYSRSKMMLFDYINCLPNRSNDVVHIETDGIYFHAKHKDAFIKNVNERNNIMIASDNNKPLGSIEFDGQSEGISYWLGKKLYYYQKKGEHVMRVKGLPQYTINDSGDDVQLIDKSFYEGLYNGEPQKRTFKTLKKMLYGETNIITYEMSRTIQPNAQYKEYNV